MKLISYMPMVGFAREIEGAIHLDFVHLRGSADPLTILCTLAIVSLFLRPFVFR